MRIALPVNGGMLSAHFGHCEQFALIDVDEAKKVIIKKEFVNSPEHQPGLLPVWLAQNDVSVVLAGGMGVRAQEIFQENNINVVVGVVETDPEKAALDYLNGSLATGGNVCDH
ncbi:NifB/NifX family molybdenum-iron cluster-binding protein [Chloroflexota bacterium]